MDKLTDRWGRIGTNSQNNKDSGREDAPAEQRDREIKDKRDGKRPAPFSLRLSFEEREQLDQDSGRQSISAYIKSRLFDPDKPIKQARGLNPVKDQQALSQALGLLGSSGLAQRLGELAKAAEIGALPVDDDTEKAIRRACDDVRIMRRFLLAALGIRETDKSTKVCESCSSAFARAASGQGDTPDNKPHKDMEP